MTVSPERTLVPAAGVVCVFAIVIAAGVITLTCEVAVLLASVAAEGSGVPLPAVVVRVTVPVTVGVKVVVQVMVLAAVAGATNTAKLAGAAVQVLLTPVAVPGTPVTAHVGAVAASGPRLVQLVTTVTGVPCVTVCVTAPVALMSAVATGVVTQRGSPATQAGGGVVQLEGEAVVQPGGGVVVLSVMTLVKLVVPVGSGVPTVTVKLAVAVPPAGTLAMVMLHRKEPVTVPVQFVVAPVKPAGKVALVFAGISSKKLTGPAVPPVLVAVKA